MTLAPSSCNSTDVIGQTSPEEVWDIALKFERKLSRTTAKDNLKTRLIIEAIYSKIHQGVQITVSTCSP